MDPNKGTFTLASVGGIAVKAHWSWLIIVAIITWTLATWRFPHDIPRQTATTYWILGLIGAVMLFVSVLIHELSHSFTARARGYKVSEIILFIFGGVSNIEEEPKQAGDEFLISVVGPLSSFVLAGVFFALSQTVTPPVGPVGADAVILSYLALINLMLGAFNMLPGFPLDGGRVLRSIIWGATHNFQRATRIAGGAGEIVAYLFIASGLFWAFSTGDYFNGLWIAFIGWFLLNAAQQSTASVVLKGAMRGVTVGQLMESPPPTCAPHMTLAHLLTQYVLPHNIRAVPVAQEGKLVGIITLNDIKHVPQDEWGMVTVGNVMTGPDKLRTVKPQEGLDKAMQLLSEGDFDQLPVVDGAGQLVGMLTRARILRWLQIRDELGQWPGGGKAA